MKTALSGSGTILPADADAPKDAICRYCGHKVILRSRRLMDGSSRHYWQHQANQALYCPGRSKAA